MVIELLRLMNSTRGKETREIIVSKVKRFPIVFAFEGYCTVMSVSDEPMSESKSSDFFFCKPMCVSSSASWDGSGKVLGERRAPPLASTPSHCPPKAMLRTHISSRKKSLDCVWLISHGHHCTVHTVYLSPINKWENRKQNVQNERITNCELNEVLKS